MYRFFEGSVDAAKSKLSRFLSSAEAATETARPPPGQAALSLALHYQLSAL